MTAEGFTAHWQSSFFATNYEERLQACLGHRHCLSDSDNPFAVSFINPVDQYLKSERAIKYALLFIALTFAGFFLFEVLKRLAVHPMQYGLVGLALALFYLLLLSLAEHVPACCCWASISARYYAVPGGAVPLPWPWDCCMACCMSCWMPRTTPC